MNPEIANDKAAEAFDETKAHFEGGEHLMGAAPVVQGPITDGVVDGVMGLITKFGAPALKVFLDKVFHGI